MNCTEVSAFLGWVSIGCWIIVYSPQLIENYRLKSGEGLSVAFVFIWLAGDLLNLVGAVLAHLLPTVIILPIYYCLCDLALVFQIYYYRRTHPVHIAPFAPTDLNPNEASPLIPQRTMVLDDRERKRSFWLQAAPYTFGTIFVLAVGAIGHFVKMEVPNADIDQGLQEHVFEWKSQIAGWCSAFLYFISRIPQIFKNLKTKCAGLSPVLFTFAMAGNSTYIASILVMSTEPSYLVVNASWIAGSAVTIFLDIIVLAQFIYFRSAERVFVPVDDTTHSWSEAH